MALEYTLELVTKHSPDEVVGILSSLGLGFESGSGLQLTAPGVDVTAASQSDLGRGIINKAYGLNTGMYVKFRLDKFEMHDMGLSTTIKAALQLLRETGADGILLFNGETPVLRRIKNILTLNKAYDFWQQPGRLSLVTEPYEFDHIAPL